MTQATQIVTWKWLVGVLVFIVGALVSVTYASATNRIAMLENGHISDVQAISILNTQHALDHQLLLEMNDKLDMILGDKPHVRK